MRCQTGVTKETDIPARLTDVIQEYQGVSNCFTIRHETQE